MTAAATRVYVALCEEYTIHFDRLILAEHAEAGRDFREEWHRAQVGRGERATLNALRKAGWHFKRVPTILVTL